ncbi:hypothetical protein IFO70_34990 [Phormidium tenue FACHB-886]|nr:hypothetical protein [Phormidium tenue FACHB-886]
MQEKYNVQIDSHLIADAVSNAVTRRDRASEESLLDLSDTETRAIMGGLTSGTSTQSVSSLLPKTVKYPPIITAGIITLPEEVI